jgi:hypothetical protein
MAGKHAKRPGVVYVRIPQQRAPRPVGITDANTRVEHLVSDESVMAQRRWGSSLAFCGATVLAASLTEPAHSRCPECAR